MISFSDMAHPRPSSCEERSAGPRLEGWQRSPSSPFEDALRARQGQVTERSRARQNDQAKCRHRSIKAANDSRFLRLALLDRRAGLLPFAEAAPDVRDRLWPHAGRGLRRERGAPAAGAEEHELLVLGELRLVIRAVRIDPELEHAARAVECAGHLALALTLARIAQVDEGHVGAAVQLARLVDAERLDLALGGVEQRLVSGGDFLRHVGLLIRLA